MFKKQKNTSVVAMLPAVARKLVQNRLTMILLDIYGVVNLTKIKVWVILGNPGATSRDDAIFSGESLLQVLRSPWELILTEPVPEVVEFRSADWAECDNLPIFKRHLKEFLSSF